MKTIVLDFDYTLFDAAKFRGDLGASLIKLGIDEKFFSETYKQVRYREGKESDYQPDKHLQILADKTDTDYLKLKDTYYQVIGEAKEYLYPDTLDFLKKMKQENNKLILLTFGNPEFQKLKVQNSGIGKYFEEIYYTDGSKTSLAHKITDDPNVTFINDNPHEILELKSIYPQATFIQISRTNGKKYQLKLSSNILRYGQLKSLIDKI